MAKQIGKFLPALQRFKNAQLGDQLPFWPSEARCAPNEFLRSALFNARNRNQPRRHMNDVVLAMLGKGRISYRGEELRQDDATVWLQLVQFATESLLGEYVEFTPNAFCKAVGWSPTGDAYAHALRARTPCRQAMGDASPMGQCQTSSIVVVLQAAGRGRQAHQM